MIEELEQVLAHLACHRHSEQDVVTEITLFENGTLNNLYILHV